jgi:hypothetical protein
MHAMLVNMYESSQLRIDQLRTDLFFVAPVLNIKHLLPYPERKKRLAFAQSFMFCSEKKA